MITKKIQIDGVVFDTFEVHTLLADGSLRGEVYNEEAPEIREKSVVIVAPWPFELTSEELSQLEPSCQESATYHTA